jgi:hypothetical protein
MNPEVYADLPLYSRKISAFPKSAFPDPPPAPPFDPLLGTPTKLNQTISKTIQPKAAHQSSPPGQAWVPAASADGVVVIPKSINISLS